MKSFKDAAKNLPGAGGFEVLTTFSCIRCRAVQKSIKTVIMGGPNKGQPLIETTECHCRLSRETAAAAKAARFNHFKKYWTVNPSIKHATMENFKTDDREAQTAYTKTHYFLQRFADHENARLIMYGNSGQGKSHLGLAAAKAAEELFKRPAIFIEVPTLKLLFKSTWNGGSITEADLLRAFREVDLLVVDDLGSEKPGEWIDEILFNIFNDRLSKPLIVTSNLDIQELSDRYHPRLIDRIFDGANKKDLMEFKSSRSYRMRRFYEEDDDE